MMKLKSKLKTDKLKQQKLKEIEELKRQLLEKEATLQLPSSTKEVQTSEKNI
jgi:hypothetical protein